MNAKIEQLIQNNLDALKALEKNIGGYYTGDVKLKNILYFLLQFQDYERIKVVLKLMLRIDMLDNGRITALVKKAMSSIAPSLRQKAIYISLGSIQDSSAMVAYPLLKNIFPDESSTAGNTGDIRSLGTLLEKEGVEAVILFDDNITTGTQLGDLFKELIEGSEKPEIVAQQLTAPQLVRLRALPIRICFAVQLSATATEKVKALGVHYQLDLQIHAGQHDYDNKLEYGMGVLTSEAEESFAKQFLGDIARQLLANKGWDPAKVEDRLLGYGNLGKLSAFYYNIPKALITPFWKSGVVNGKEWIPLLPEIREHNRMIDEQITPDHDISWAVDQVLKNAPAHREPEIMIGFKVNDDLDSTVTINIPTAQWLEKEIFSTHPCTLLPYERPNPKESLQAMLESIYPATPSPEEQAKYDRYRAAVDQYNVAYSAYYEQVKKYMQLYATKTMVPFAIGNAGQAAATELKVEMFVDSAQVLVGKLSELEKPTFNLIKPTPAEFGIGLQPRSITARKSFFDSFSKQPFQIGEQYHEVILNNPKLVHKNLTTIQLEIVRMDSGLTGVNIPCTINYEQVPDLIREDMRIKFQESDSIPETQKDNILSTFQSFFQTFSYEPPEYLPYTPPVNFLPGSF